MRWLPLLLVLGSCAPRGTELTVSAAASLQNAMKDIATGYRVSHPGVIVTLNFGSSGTLAQQIEQGAPADVFFSAAPKPMDSLAARGLIRGDTRRDILHNEIVLIGSAASFTALATVYLAIGKGRIEAEVGTEEWAVLAVRPQPWLVQLDTARLLLLNDSN